MYIYQSSNTYIHIYKSSNTHTHILCGAFNKFPDFFCTGI